MGVREYSAEEEFWASEAGGKRRLENLHNEERQNFNSCLNFIKLIKNRRMRWAGHAGKGNAFRKNLKGREHLENLGMDRRIMLKCIIIEWECRVWTFSSGLGQETVVGCTNCREFPGQVSNF